MTRLQAIICGTTHSRTLADGRRDQDHQPRRAGRSGLRERGGGAQGRRRRMGQRRAIHDLSRALPGRAEIQGVPAARVSRVVSEWYLPAEHAGDGGPAGGRIVSAGSPDAGGALSGRALRPAGEIMIDRRSLCAALAAASMLVCTAREGAAQSYPQRPVRLVVPAPAGGPTDVPGRLIAEGLSGLLGQRFVVENRVGAGGLLAGEFVARSEPNGYTLLYANTSVLAVNPALQ